MSPTQRAPREAHGRVADIVIRSVTGAMRGADFDNRHQAIIEGEKAGLAAIAAIKLKVTEKTVTVTKR